uniref:Uncharacterized protein n=1 Tax=Caenorhabditis tropicalis TaxID=1561998 RepID=A0A1I7T3Y7_9PELO
MDIWLLVLIVDYIIAAIGLIANLVYFKSVVLNTLYDGYWSLLTINISLFVSFWLFVMNVIPFGYMYQYFLLYDIVGEIKNGDHVDGVRQLNGNKINTTQSQEEYFLQLQSTWA